MLRHQEHAILRVYFLLNTHFEDVLAVEATPLYDVFEAQAIQYLDSTKWQSGPCRLCSNFFTYRADQLSIGYRNQD